MKLHIPRLGEELILLNDWDFQLYNEMRNESLSAYLGLNIAYFAYEFSGKLFPTPARINAGSTLIVDRIYIRRGNSNFDSLTFRLKGAKVPKRNYTYENGQLWGANPQGVRFWTKLDDVNNMEIM